MNKSKKIRVAVLYGGRSSEHDVSLVSATNVIKHLDRSRFEVIPIGIDKQGSWFLGDDVFNKEITSSAVLRLQCDQDRMLFNPNLIGTSAPAFLSTEINQMSKTTRSLFDVVFPVIHGPLCEDGTVQGFLELANIPYVGCGVLASAIGMEKDISKRLIHHAGISVPPYLTVKQIQWDKNSRQFCDEVNQTLRYPVFVKPVNTGSSVGVHKVKDPKDLNAAICDAFKYDTKVIVEQGIVDAIEIEVAVLESLNMNGEPIVSVAGEIRPSANHEFYSYESKYLDEDGAKLIIPAEITEQMQSTISNIAQQIFKTLECEGMARIDLFLERRTNQIYFNEINSIPGFTEISMYPKLMAATGVNYSDLLTHLVMLAKERHTKKSKLSREFVSDKA